MGIWSRLGNVIKSYLNDEEEKIFGKSGFRRRSDPDIDAAYEELDEFLAGGSSAGSGGEGSADGKGQKTRPIPEDVRKDFAELGLTPGASAGECKEAYKKLLKIHHPDRHANHPGNMRKATEKTARVNAAYERLERWFQI